MKVRLRPSKKVTVIPGQEQNGCQHEQSESYLEETSFWLSGIMKIKLTKWELTAKIEVINIKI